MFLFQTKQKTKNKKTFYFKENIEFKLAVLGGMLEKLFAWKEIFGFDFNKQKMITVLETKSTANGKHKTAKQGCSLDLSQKERRFFVVLIQWVVASDV
jgi:hypothetical protein